MNYYYNPYYPWPYYQPMYERRYCPCCGSPYYQGFTTPSITWSDTNTTSTMPSSMVEFLEGLKDQQKKEEEKEDRDRTLANDLSRCDPITEWINRKVEKKEDGDTK